MSFALRTAFVGAWSSEFQLSNEQVGWINGAAFWGFTLAMMIGGPLCDAIGMKRIVWFAFVGHLAGIILTIVAWNYTSLYIATLIFGIANGAVEAACNPLITTLFPADKTTKLNRFHAWFPGGLVIGGLLAYALGGWGVAWRVQFACMLLPLACYGVMFRGEVFPQTERVQRGVSTASMFAACFRPLFILMVACMLLTAATEFGAQGWIPNIMTNAGVSGILVLVWITGLMALGRQFAGAFVHRLSSMGMLTAGAILSALGLYAMSHASGYMLFGAATVFAFGVCFFWPTMLGFVSENFPSTGALGLAIMGGAGMLSASFILPLVGRFYDRGIVERLPAGADAATAPLNIQAAAGLEALGKLAALPLTLAVVFGALLVLRKRRAEPQVTAARVGTVVS